MSAKTLIESETEPQYSTLGVLAGAYKGGRRDLKNMLTHTFDQKSSSVLCKKVSSDSIADPYSSTASQAAEPPTCAVCLKRDPRFK